MKFKKLVEEAILPTRSNPTDAGLDLYSTERFRIPEGDFDKILTGVAVEIPEGYYGRIAPRSGMAAKYGIDVLAGVVDSSYRGEIGVVLLNNGHRSFEILPGDRIAQLIITKIETPEPVWKEELDETSRGDGGFGSTGT